MQENLGYYCIKLGCGDLTCDTNNWDNRGVGGLSKKVLSQENLTISGLEVAIRTTKNGRIGVPSNKEVNVDLINPEGDRSFSVWDSDIYLSTFLLGKNRISILYLTKKIDDTTIADINDSVAATPSIIITPSSGDKYLAEVYVRKDVAKGQEFSKMLIIPLFKINEKSVLIYS